MNFKFMGCLRLFSTSASSTTKVPLQIHSLEGRYASALFSASIKNNELATVEKDLANFKAIVFSSQSIQSMMQDPSFGNEKRKSGILSVLLSLKCANNTKSLFEIISDNGRLPLVPKIITAFEEIMQAFKQQVSIKVITAKELEGQEINKIKEIAKEKLLKRGQVPVFQTQTDPRILGGFIIEAADKTVDLSVRSRLNSMEKALESSLD